MKRFVCTNFITVANNYRILDKTLMPGSWINSLITYKDCIYHSTDKNRGVAKGGGRLQNRTCKWFKSGKILGGGGMRQGARYILAS